MRKTLALAVALGMLAAAPIARAAITDLFGGTVSCSVQAGNDDERHCSGIFTTFDGSPIDVNVGFPAEPATGPDGNFPIIGVFHGWGGSKLGLTSGAMQEWLNEGYAVFSMSDRGWGNSCGGLDPQRLIPGLCDNGYNHLMDTRYEVRDAQEVFEALADQPADGATGGEGLIDPQAIGATGPSYGGGISAALGTLKNRKMMGGGMGPPTMPVDGFLVPWMSPGGKAMEIAAAQPDIPWTDLAYSLLPNGHTLDYVTDAPYIQRGRIGVMKQSFVAGLYGLGQALSNYALPGTDPDADIDVWYAEINAGEPYDQNPLAADVADEVTRHHSSYYIDSSTAPAPMLFTNGWTDDLFPVDEAIRFYNRTRAIHPGTPIALYFADQGHQRGQNKSADAQLRDTAQHEWFSFYVKGTGPQPFLGVQATTQVCGGPSAGPFSAATWAALAPGEFRLESAAAQVIATSVASDGPVGQAYDPIVGPGACATASSADQVGAATYRSDAVPAGGFTLMGSPEIIADINSPGPTSQLAARLLDVDPGSGNQTLVARGLYRPEITTTTAACQVFQLHANGWKFEEGHIVKLELLPADQPYGRNSNGQAPITVENLRLRLPVLESPGALGGLIDSPSDKVVPAGYTLSGDVTVGIDTTSCPQASTTTTTSSSSSSTAVSTSTSVPPVTTTTTTLPPGFDLTLRRARLKGERSPGAANGSVLVKGDFALPPNFNFPPPFTIVVRDGTDLNLGHTFDSCRTSSSGAVVCRDTTTEGVFRAAMRPLRSNLNVVRFRASFRRQAITGPFAAPVTMTLIHDDVVVRSDDISDCKTRASGGIACRERR